MFKPIVFPLALTLLTSGLLTQQAAPALAAQQTPTLTWTTCPNDKVGMTCADLQVPADWQKPDGRKITLKLGRLKATGTSSEGSVLIAYGGPGGPGIALTQTYANLWAKLRERMDVVTWDTRGYGEQFGGLSTGLACTWTRVPLPDFPEDDADFGRLSDTNRGYAEACRNKDPELFANMSSADNARDMEAIRKALGEAKLNFYGASYAGIYAQDYARLFPGQVRTMVLDGTISHSGTDWTTDTADMAKDNETSFTRFSTWCAGAGKCQEVPAQWRGLVAKADRSPIPAKSAGIAYTGRDLQSLALGIAQQGADGYPKLTDAIRKAVHGDASGFVPARGARYPDQSTGVTECTDWPRPASRAELNKMIARLRKIAPNTGTANTLATGTLGCVGWPVSVTNPPAPLPKGLPPMLGAGAWRESDAVARILTQVPGSATIHHDGPGHTLYASNECARTHIIRYFTDRTLPSESTKC
ncbi:alpha/beta fold hydrolase [Nonomuraea sp. NEAU-A123]|uniref:alpha/beta fold hydrolase n=1 Tax=Nonomuraea sp. NEAU-A123 TaxID=2839649 RepID=UPI001BE45864|nr:alpha/beta fold hydrolase [Nonomuraea sp. NEAU-A123]MBT2230910.1 alpha/beta hydrolase [Nonomuraea sp. NEAU-A123]